MNLNGQIRKVQSISGQVVKSGISGSENVTWHQCPELVRNYLANVTYDPSDYTTSQITNYAPATAVESNYRPVGVTAGAETYYNQEPNAQTPFANSSKAGTLKPLDSLRWIKTTAQNVRDLGGWACDGGTVKYGLLFRGGALASTDRAVLVEELGIQHDLDLRGTNEAGLTESPLGSDVYYTCATTFAWYTLTATCWKLNLRTVFDAVMHNEPVYMHCSVGADRAGTIACVIEGLLGVAQSDVDKDYELTCFDTGTDTDNHARRRNESEWQGLITEINAKSGSTFRDKCVSFVVELGFTAAEINAFRAAMIDGTPETVTPSIATYTVTNTISNAITDNSATSASQYQPYVAKIAAVSGYVISSVAVTMNGSDITASVWDGRETNLLRAINTALTNCSVSNSSKRVIDGQSYATAVTAADGYTLVGATVLITMGGVDVSTYYKDGTIAIPCVTGDITITITAVAQTPSYTNQIPISTQADGEIYNEIGYQLNTRVNSSGQDTAGTGLLATGFIPCAVGDTIRLNKFVSSLTTYGGNAKLVFYDSSLIKKAGVNANKLASVYGYTQGSMLQLTIPNTIYSTDDGSDNSLATAAYVRLVIGGYNDEADSIICTINEEIT